MNFIRQKQKTKMINISNFTRIGKSIVTFFPLRNYSKIEKHRIRKLTMYLLRDHLEDRTQTLTMGLESSENTITPHGLLQRTMLSLIFYLLFIISEYV